MTPTDMTILHDPENGFTGNCAQASYASLLDMNIDDIPHFADGLDETDEDGMIFTQRVNDFLKEIGYGIICFAVHEETIDEWKHYAAKCANHHLISGRTERGTLHLVVGKAGEVIHDPHPSHSGLLPPTEEDPWYFEFIVKRL